MPAAINKGSFDDVVASNKMLIAVVFDLGKAT
jgi:hypothetical protein